MIVNGIERQTSQCLLQILGNELDPLGCLNWLLVLVGIGLQPHKVPTSTGLPTTCAGPSGNCMLLCSGRTHTADNDMTWKTTTAQIYLLAMQNQPLHIRLPCHQPTLSHPKECPTEIWWEKEKKNGCRTSVKWSDRYPTYWPWSEASVSVITGITLWLARPLGPNQKMLVALQTRITLSHSSLRHITKEHRQKHKISSAQWGSCTRLETSIEIPQIASEPFQRQCWETSERWVEHIWAFPSPQIPSWTKLNRT